MPARVRGSGVTTRAAAASAPPDTPSPAGAPSRLRTALVLLNEGTKFSVSAAALAVLIYHRSAAASYALCGSVINSLAGKALKRVLKHARPPGARKADPGMPSSHGVSLGYLATYAAAALLSASSPPDAQHAVAAAALQALGVFLAALRVALGYHTAPQVVVGYVFGSVNALALHAAGTAAVLPALAAAPGARTALYVATAVAIAVFAAAGAKSWVEDARHVLRLHAAQRTGSSASA